MQPDLGKLQLDDLGRVQLPDELLVVLGHVVGTTAGVTTNTFS